MWVAIWTWELGAFAVSHSIAGMIALLRFRKETHFAWALPVLFLIIGGIICATAGVITGRWFAATPRAGGSCVHFHSSCTCLHVLLFTFIGCACVRSSHFNRSNVSAFGCQHDDNRGPCKSRAICALIFVFHAESVTPDDPFLSLSLSLSVLVLFVCLFVCLSLSRPLSRPLRLLCGLMQAMIWGAGQFGLYFITSFYHNYQAL